MSPFRYRVCPSSQGSLNLSMLLCDPSKKCQSCCAFMSATTLSSTTFASSLNGSVDRMSEMKYILRCLAPRVFANSSVNISWMISI
jgi:hypothetical protein